MDAFAYYWFRPTCLASAGSEGAEPVWSKGPVLKAYSADRASVFTQWPCPDKFCALAPVCSQQTKWNILPQQAMLGPLCFGSCSQLIPTSTYFGAAECEEPASLPTDDALTISLPWLLQSAGNIRLCTVICICGHLQIVKLSSLCTLADVCMLQA